MAIKNKEKLSDTPSQLILDALTDLRKCEADPNYAINMGIWHSGTEGNEICKVCLAGAVLAKTIEWDINEYSVCSEKDFEDDKELADKMIALDYFRTGEIHGALCYLDMDQKYFEDKIEEFRKIPDYHDDREGFYEEMVNLASDLQALGM